ncbi:MAG: class I SAM-dependent methyltransferase [Desulfobacterales bacterium]|nr:class I SAM-dependent methyltransferase [Desulfobacterales bacterium]
MPPLPDYLKAPFRMDGFEKIQDLHRILIDKGFCEATVAQAIGSSDFTRQTDLTVALFRTAESTPFHTLVRLFILAQPLPESAVRNALHPLPLSELFNVGLLKADAGGIRSEAALLAYNDLYLLRDFWPEYTGKPCPSDYVLGIGPASLAVAEMTVRTPVASALDIGTGGGYQALLAAKHCERVTATDTNPRALNFAALNARLNGISNITFRLGSLYEPVANEQFDLVVSNPPFVISPEHEFEYRDNAMAGDAFCEAALRGAAQQMNEGAFGTILFNWQHHTDEDWPERPRQWLAESRCDAWLIHSRSEDPLTYAAGWLHRDYAKDPVRYQTQLEKWLAYFDREKIGKISLGAVILRKRSSGPNWFHADQSPSESANGSCSDQILRVFAAQDALTALSDDRELLQKSFLLTPDHQLEHVLHSENSRWSVKQALLTQTKGLRITGNVDRLVGDILAGCDGSRPLIDLVTELSGHLRVDAEKIIPSCLNVIKKLLENGFLSANTRSSA